MAPRSGIELDIFDRFDPTLILAHLGHRSNPTYLDEMGGHGGGSFAILKEDKVFTDYLTGIPARDLLHEGNFVRVQIHGERVGWWVIRNVAEAVIGKKEAQSEVYVVSGPGLRSLLDRAIVYPEGGFQPDAPEHRVFNFASVQGPWYRSADWTDVVTNGRIDAPLGTHPWATYPRPLDEWPEPSSQWIWDRVATGVVPVGDVYFRKTFTTHIARTARIYMACDNLAEVWLDGVLYGNTPVGVAYKKFQTVDVNLRTGDHVMAVKATNLEGGTLTSNPGVLNLVLVTLPADPEAPMETIIQTDGSWKCVGYPERPPGWSPGQVLNQLLNESDDRDVESLSLLGRDFTGTKDAYNVDWPDDLWLEWSFPVGTKYGQVVDVIEETAADVWCGSLLEINAAPQRGTDRSVQNDRVQPVTFTKGMNVTGAESEGQGELITALLVKHSSGWLEREATTQAITANGRWEDYLSISSGSAALASRAANSLLAVQQKPQRYPTISITDHDEHRPFVHFLVGDWVSAPETRSEGQTSRRVMSIAASEDPKTGRVLYDIEVDSIRANIADRHERWINAMSRGGVGGLSRSALTGAQTNQQKHDWISSQGEGSAVLEAAIETATEDKADVSHTHTASQVTDFTVAADARVAAAVGVSVQAYDPDLTAFAAKTAPTGTVVGTTDAQTLTNKTLTSPAISSPTGLVKADVGLGSVTNDAQLKVASNLSDLASVPTARTNLGLGTAALAAAPIGTILGTTDTQTVTNKRVTPRFGSGSTAATAPTPSGDLYDVWSVTGLTTGCTFGVPAGTPTAGQRFMLRISDDGTVRTLGWNAIYNPVGAALPPTTIVGTPLYVDLMWNDATTKWDVLNVSPSPGVIVRSPNGTVYTITVNDSGQLGTA